jgi:hypothetical protein
MMWLKLSRLFVLFVAMLMPLQVSAMAANCMKMSQANQSASTQMHDGMSAHCKMQDKQTQKQAPLSHGQKANCCDTSCNLCTGLVFSSLPQLVIFENAREFIALAAPVFVSLPLISLDRPPRALN